MTNPSTIDIYPKESISQEEAHEIDNLIRTATANSAKVESIHNYGSEYAVIVRTTRPQLGARVIAHTLQHSNLIKPIGLEKNVTLLVGLRSQIPVSAKL